MNKQAVWVLYIYLLNSYELIVSYGPPKPSFGRSPFFFFSGLMTGPTYWPLVWHSNANTPLVPIKGACGLEKKTWGQYFFSATLTGLTYLLKHISKYSTVPLRLDVQITHHGQSWTEQIWVSSRITRLDEHHQNKLKFGQKFFFPPWQSFPSNFVIWNCAWLCS